MKKLLVLLGIVTLLAGGSVVEKIAYEVPPGPQVTKSSIAYEVPPGPFRMTTNQTA
ncbi:hypothetical protein [Tumebacillus permanentifrigoris]|uniref:hypothetical protein n=1 Tax=Tumebacillus permanentifrigoris TaxID=378543 RepID=UPI001473543C|nr:hypothetical protein [Tumebacillus permanentifrigoris]